MATFTHKLTLVFCIMAFACASLMTATPSIAAQDKAAASSTTGRGTTSKTSTVGAIQSGAAGAISKGKGYADDASGLISGAQGAANSLSGAAGSLGLGSNALGGLTGGLGDASGYLNKGQSALDTAGKASDILGNLSNVDMGSITSGLGSLGNLGLGGLGGNLGKAAENIMKNAGKYWDGLKGINLDSIWGGITNFNKDMTGMIKQLIAGNLASFDLTSLSSVMTSVGVPVTLVDLGPVGVSTVVFEGQIPLAMDAQYASETDYSAALGPIGSMDFRNGQCIHNGHDYSGMLKDYINGAGTANEGNHPYLYLDTYCWITIGKGSLLSQYTSPRNWDGYKRYFDTMAYTDAAGNPVSQAQKDADLRLFFDKEGSCRAECGCSAAATAATCTTGTVEVKGKRVRCCTNMKKRDKGGDYCINEGYKTQAAKSGGRKISTQAVGDAIFNELCKSHIPGLVKRSGGAYPKFNIKLQEVLLDVSYQGGGGTSSMGGLITRLKSGSCGTAASGFASSELCTKFPGRCKWRLGALTSGCSMGVYASQ